MNLTFAELKTKANWSEVLNVCVTDSRFLIWLNDALERLMPKLYVGMTRRYQFCTSESTITVPRFFETFEVVDVCNTPWTIRNQWYEYLENGPGLLGTCTSTGTANCYSQCPSYTIIDRGGNFAMFADITETSKLRFRLTNEADAGKTIRVRGYDSNGDYVLNADGTEGELITLAYPYVDSTTAWRSQIIRQVIKEATLGFVKVHSYALGGNPADPALPLTALAVYEPSETLPDYRRYYVPALASSASCGCSASCTTPTITVVAKLRFIPIVSDEDFIPIANVPALKLAMRAVMLEERGDYEGAKICMHGSFDPIRRKYVNGAIPLLEDELDSFQGAGTVASLRLESSRVDRAYVDNML